MDKKNSVSDFDQSIIDLGISLTTEAANSRGNPEHRFNLIGAIVNLRGSISNNPPNNFSAKDKRG